MKQEKNTLQKEVQAKGFKIQTNVRAGNRLYGQPVVTYPSYPVNDPGTDADIEIFS